MTAKLTDFRVLTFDCYGTLIDWESGILAALRPLRERLGATADDESVLEEYGRLEHAQERATPGLKYTELLAAVAGQLGRVWGGEASSGERAAFGASVGDWPAFADSPAALGSLGRHYALVILSNVDRASFARSEERLGVRFDAVHTAEEIGSYKPDPRNFDYLVRRVQEQFGVGPEGILHTAQSLFHDHVPAKAAGLATAWIDRRAGRAGSGATAPVDERPAFDFRFETLADMAAAVEREQD